MVKTPTKEDEPVRAFHRFTTALLCAVLLILTGCEPRSWDSPPTPEPQESQSLPEQVPTPAEPAPPSAETPEKADYNPFSQQEEQALAQQLGTFLSLFGPASGDGTVKGGEFFSPSTLNEEAILYYCMMDVYSTQGSALERIDDFFYAISADQVGEAAGRLLGLEGFRYQSGGTWDAERGVYLYSPNTGLPIKIYQVTETAYTEDSKAYYDVVFYSPGDEQMAVPIKTLYYQFAVGEAADGAYYLIPEQADNSPLRSPN